MNVAFHIQDPTSPDTVYLFEAIIGALRGASLCMGIFAFASRAGVDSLIGDPEIRRFLRRSSMSLLVGIDAVTTRATIERIRELEQEHRHLTVRVFRNPTDALFHPKVARFEYPDGCRHDGAFGEQEVRPCVYSRSNRNLKIEIASHRGEPYPDGGSPIVVYRDLQARSFAYMLLMPGDPGYGNSEQLPRSS